VPIRGLITASEKFHIPVRNAKMVPSMPGGVILAKRARLGRTQNAKERHPKTTSVKIMKTRSDIPSRRFHLSANTKWTKEDTTEITVE